MSAWIDAHPMGTLVGDPLPGSPELAARGNVVIGVRTVTLTNPGQADILAGLSSGRFPRRDRSLQVEVWYPALPGSDDSCAVYTDHMGRADWGNLEAYEFQGRAFRDAEPNPAAGPCPAVVISHGFSGSRVLFSNLAENLASKGYVVLAIGHTGDTYTDFPTVGAQECALVHRSLDQRFVISQIAQLNKEGFLRGMLLPDQVALIGFSMGGYGTLRTIGGRLNVKALEQFKALAEELREAPDFHGLKTVKAAVLFAPASFWHDAAHAEDIDLPTLWVCGSADRMVGYANVRSACQQATRSERTLITYEGCGHSIACNPAPALAQARGWEIYRRWADSVWDTRRLNSLNAHFVTAFLDRHLRYDAAKATYLAPAAPGDAIVGFPADTTAGIRIEYFPKA